MSRITAKQRRNAERELTSVVCAGCDGEKERGFSFCQKCTDLLVTRGKKTGVLGFLTANLRFTPEDYMTRLGFLLSPEGQRLRMES